jgi:outer membrane lipoprotein-sorting protein
MGRKNVRRGLVFLLFLLVSVGCSRREEAPVSVDISRGEEAAREQLDTTAATVSIETVLEEIEKKIQSVWSYEATFEIDFGEKETVEGNIAFVKPDRLRMEMIVGTDEKTRQYLYSDGQTLWQYLPSFMMASKVDLVALKAEFPEEAAALIEGQSDIQGALADIDKGKIEYLGVTVLNGESMYVFQGDVASGYDSEMEIAGIKVWISQDDGLQRRVEYYSADGERIYQHQLGQVEVNIEIPAERFHFDAPEGVTVLDTTEEGMEFLKGKEGQNKTGVDGL